MKPIGIRAAKVNLDPDSKSRIASATLPTLERWAPASREVTRVSELFELD